MDVVSRSLVYIVLATASTFVITIGTCNHIALTSSPHSAIHHIENNGYLLYTTSNSAADSVFIDHHKPAPNVLKQVESQKTVHQTDANRPNIYWHDEVIKVAKYEEHIAKFQIFLKKRRTSGTTTSRPSRPRNALMNLLAIPSSQRTVAHTRAESNKVVYGNWNRWNVSRTKHRVGNNRIGRSNCLRTKKWWLTPLAPTATN